MGIFQESIKQEIAVGAQNKRRVFRAVQMKQHHNGQNLSKDSWTPPINRANCVVFCFNALNWRVLLWGSLVFFDLPDGHLL
jgi:hypothetical protein